MLKEQTEQRKLKALTPVFIQGMAVVRGPFPIGNAIPFMNPIRQAGRYIEEWTDFLGKIIQRFPRPILKGCGVNGFPVKGTSLNTQSTKRNALTLAFYHALTAFSVFLRPESPLPKSPVSYASKHNKYLCPCNVSPERYN